MGPRGAGRENLSGMSARHDRNRRRFLQTLGAVVAPLPSVPSAMTAGAPTMITRPIPRSGEALPVVGLGTWQAFDVGPRAAEREELKEVLRLLVDSGGKVVDSPPMYGQAERVVGDLTSDLKLRDKLFFATKVWTSGREAGI